MANLQMSARDTSKASAPMDFYKNDFASVYEDVSWFPCFLLPPSTENASCCVAMPPSPLNVSFLLGNPTRGLASPTASPLADVFFNDLDGRFCSADSGDGYPISPPSYRVAGDPELNNMWSDHSTPESSSDDTADFTELTTGQDFESHEYQLDDSRQSSADVISTRISACDSILASPGLSITKTSIKNAIIISDKRLAQRKRKRRAEKPKPVKRGKPSFNAYKRLLIHDLITLALIRCGKLPSTSLGFTDEEFPTESTLVLLERLLNQDDSARTDCVRQLSQEYEHIGPISESVLKECIKSYLPMMSKSSAFRIESSEQMDRGGTVFACEPIQKNTRIEHLVGPHISFRAMEIPPHATISPISTIQGTYRNGKLAGPASFVRHDCIPNAKLSSEEDHRSDVYAIRAIKAGDEVTIDFGTNLAHCDCRSCAERILVLGRFTA